MGLYTKHGAWASLVPAAITKTFMDFFFLRILHVNYIQFVFFFVTTMMTYHAKLITTALTLQQDLVFYSFNENWKKPIKSSIKAKRSSNITSKKNLNALENKLGLYQLLNG